MCPSLVAKTCLHQKAVHSGSNAAQVRVTIPLHYYFSFVVVVVVVVIIIHSLSGSSFNTAKSHLLKHLIRIAAGAGPSVHSARGG